MNSVYLEDFYNYISSQKRYSNNTLLAYQKDLTLFFDFIKKENIANPIDCFLGGGRDSCLRNIKNNNSNKYFGVITEKRIKRL